MAIFIIDFCLLSFDNNYTFPLNDRRIVADHTAPIFE